MSLLDAMIYGVRDVLANLTVKNRHSRLNFGTGLAVAEDVANDCNTVTATGVSSFTGTGLATTVAGVGGAALAVGTAYQLARTNAGATAWEAGAVALDQANATSGSLALSKVVSPTSTGLVKVSGAAWVAAAATLVDADVSASAAVAISKLAPGTNAQVMVTNAGGTAWVGVTVSGDATITAAGAVVNAKINGTSVPAGGALTTGNAAYVSGASATTYSALNLAGGSGWVVNALPGANVVPTFGAQAISGTSTLALGTTPATAGQIMVPNNVNVIQARSADNTVNYPLLSIDNFNDVAFNGDAASQANGANTGYLCAGVTLYSRIGTATQLALTANKQQFYADANWTWGTRTAKDVAMGVNNGTTLMTLKGDASAVTFAVPMIGSASPYGVHGKIAVATANSFSVSASAYIYDHIRLTDNSVGTATFPNPATDAAAYTKFVGNPSTQTKTITTGAGATVILLTGTGGDISFDATVGCVLKSAAIAYT